MKNLLSFIFVILLSLCFISTGNTEDFYFNGYDWQKLHSSSKKYFVLGWSKCGIAANDNILTTLYNDDNKFIESTKAADRQHYQFIYEGLLISGVTIGQIVETINSVYSDPRTTTIDISDIMPLVSGRLINGWTLKELDEVISIKSRLIQCEKVEKEKSKELDECNSLRRKMNSYLQELRRK